MAFAQLFCVILLVGFGVDVARAADCKPQEPKCPPMWSHYNGHCYRLFGAGKTFADAEAHCQEFAQIGMGHVASVTSAGENNLLFNIWKSARATTDGALWLGFTDVAGDGNFAWSDGSAVSYTNWSSGEPNNRGSPICVHMRFSQNLWNDAECDSHSWSYICKMATTN